MTEQAFDVCYTTCYRLRVEKTFQSDVAGKDGRQWQVKVTTFSGPQTAPRCVGMEVQALDHIGPLRASDLRGIPLAEQLENAVRRHREKERRDQLFRLSADERKALGEARNRKRSRGKQFRRVQYDRNVLLAIVKGAREAGVSHIEEVANAFKVDYFAAAQAIKRHQIIEELERFEAQRAQPSRGGKRTSEAVGKRNRRGVGSRTESPRGPKAKKGASK